MDVNYAPYERDHDRRKEGAENFDQRIARVEPAMSEEDFEIVKAEVARDNEVRARAAQRLEQRRKHQEKELRDDQRQARDISKQMKAATIGRMPRFNPRTSDRAMADNAKRKNA